MINQLCEPIPNNAITSVVSSAISSTTSQSVSNQGTASPDPLSWEPLLRQLGTFFLKACPR